MTRLVHWLLSHWGPLVPKWERNEARQCAHDWWREANRLQADLDFAYSVNANLITTIAAQDHEMSNLKKAGTDR